MSKNQILEVEVSIPQKAIEANPEILNIYSQEKGCIKFEIDNSIPKEFGKKLKEMMPNFSAIDIIEFNPLINAINELQQIKILIPDADEDFDKNERTYIDNNKLIGSFNSAIKKSKTIIKEPHISFNKKVDELFKLFEKESENTRNALNHNFNSVVEERERIKKEKEDKKKEEELKRIQDLTSSNMEMEEKLKNQKVETAISEIENNLNKMVVNVVQKLPTLNVEGLETLKTALKNLHESQYISLENQTIIGHEKFLEFREVFNDNKASCIRQVESAINSIALIEKQKEIDSKNEVNNINVNSPINVSEEVIPEIPSAVPVEIEEIKEPKNDIEKFQFITDFNNKITNLYEENIAVIQLMTFDHPDLEKLKLALIEKQYPNLLEWTKKLSDYTNKKNELIINTLK